MLANKNLSDFIEELLKEKNLAGLEQEVIEQLKKDLQTRLEDRINAVILSKIPDEKLNEFEDLLDNPSEAKIETFLNNNIPDLDTLVSLELINFRKLYLA